MTVTIDIGPELETELRDEAVKQGNAKSTAAKRGACASGLARIAATLCVALVHGVSVYAQSSTKPITQPPQAYEAIPSTQVSLMRPKGFTKAVRFPGFQQSDSSSSVVTQVPSPYAAVSGAFNKGPMATRDIVLLDKQPHPVRGHPGVLLHVTQKASGIVFEKWILAFGDANVTFFVTAAFPQALHDTLSEPLKACVSHARWNEGEQLDPLAGLRFDIDVRPPFRLATRIGDTLMWTEDGKVVHHDADGALFFAGYALSDLPAVYRNDHKGYSLKNLAEFHVSRQTVDSVSPITVDGLSGYEVLARGVDTKYHTPVIVYETLLFENQTYFLMGGTVGQARSGGYLPLFQAMARSFTRKPSAQAQ